MKSLLLLSLLFSCTQFLSGQAIQKVVAIAPIGYSQQNSSADQAMQIYNYVLNSLQQTQRIKVVDRLSGQPALVKEKSLQSGADFVDGDVVEQGRMSGAQYVLITHVNSTNTISLQDKKTGEVVGYEGNISLFFRILSVESGLVVASAIVTPKNVIDADVDFDAVLSAAIPGIRTVGGITLKLNKYPATEEAAILQAMEETEPNIRRFIDKAFPLELRIGDIQEVADKKGRMSTEIFILGGRSTGLKSGDVLNVMQLVSRQIAGKSYTDDVQIGTIKVDRVSEDLVVCDVRNSDGIIEKAFAENKDNLKVVFIDAGFKLFK